LWPIPVTIILAVSSAKVDSCSTVGDSSRTAFKPSTEALGYVGLKARLLRAKLSVTGGSYNGILVTYFSTFDASSRLRCLTSTPSKRALAIAVASVITQSVSRRSRA